MKTIQSAGGPLIGIDADYLECWLGIFGKNFFVGEERFKNDYEFAGNFTDGRGHPPCAVALLRGRAASGILISMPLETSIVDISPDFLCIAQVDYGDPDWRFDEVTLHDFNQAIFEPRDQVKFSCKSCTYVLFDAAYAGRDVGDDCLTFNLAAGEYVISCAAYEPDDRTGLLLYKIQRS